MKKDILIIAQSEHDKLFGGYTSVTIDKNKGDAYCNDSNSFVFSLTQQTKHALKQG